MPSACPRPLNSSHPDLEMFSALYDFCRDQGGIIGGLLALAAGYLVFSSVRRSADQQVTAVNAQTEAVRQQNRDLRDEARHRQARDAMVALKLLGSVLAIIRDDVDRLKQLLEQPRYGGTNRIVPTNYRQLLYRPSLSILWDDLGMCSPQTISNYLRLDAGLAEFVRSQVYVVDIMQNEVQEISDILELLERELANDTARHDTTLGESSNKPEGNGTTSPPDGELTRKLIKQIGLDLAKDPEFAPLILEPLKIQGVGRARRFCGAAPNENDDFARREFRDSATGPRHDQKGVRCQWHQIRVSDGANCRRQRALRLRRHHRRCRTPHTRIGSARGGVVLQLANRRCSAFPQCDGLRAACATRRRARCSRNS